MTTEQLFETTAKRRAKENFLLTGNFPSTFENRTQFTCICGGAVTWAGKNGICVADRFRYQHQHTEDVRKDRILMAKPLKSLAGTGLHIGAVVRLAEPPLDSEDRDYFEQCLALGTKFMVSGYNLAEDMLELSEIESDGRPYGQDSPQWTYMAPISSVEKVADFITIKNND